MLSVHSPALTRSATSITRRQWLCINAITVSATVSPPRQACASDYFAGSKGVHPTLLSWSLPEMSTPRVAPHFFQQRAVNGFAGAWRLRAGKCLRVSRYRFRMQVRQIATVKCAPCDAANHQQGFVENDGRLHATLRKSKGSSGMRQPEQAYY